MTIEYDPATKSVKLISPDGIVIGSADMSSIATEGGVAIESGKVVWGSYANGTFTPATDKKNATPYVELTLANSSANKIYIAVADLVNEHKAGTGISITNNTDGTRTIGLTDAVNTKLSAIIFGFSPDTDGHKLIALTGNNMVNVFTTNNGL